MARREQKQEVALPPGGTVPYVGPGVSAAAVDKVAAYRAGVASRRAGALPKDNTPVAGGEAPKIPLLSEQPGQTNLTMEQHAELARAAQPPIQPQAQPQPQETGFVEAPPPAPVHPSQSQSQATALDLRIGDVLPEAATKDSAFVEGFGSMAAVHQPNLAIKYGVMRNGQAIPPQKLRSPTGEKGQLSPGTMHDLEQLKKLQEGQGLQGVGAAESQIPDGAAAAATAGNLPGDTSEQPLSTDERKRAEEALSDMDEFEFDTFRQAMMKDLLNNPEQKKIIEARLAPLDVGELITQQYITQRVPIVPSKFEPEFVTLDGQTDLEMKRMIMEESKTFEISDRYFLDKYSLMSIAAGLHAINGKQYPDYRDAKGVFDEEKFKMKLTLILRHPMHMLASLGVHQFWFEARVRSLFVAEKLGNG